MRLDSLRLHAPVRARQTLALCSLLALAALSVVVTRPRRDAGYDAHTAASAPSDAIADSVMATPAVAPSAPTPARASTRLAEVAVTGSASTRAPNAIARPAQDVAPDASAMIVRTGAASVEVDSIDAATARVRALAARLGGFVANASLAAGRAQVKSATLEVKVPAARFDELVSGLAPLGRVETVNVSAEDVGEEFVDVSAREANARRLETRLVALLADRAGRLVDVLAVERELARVREEIERYEGRLRYLRAHTATSTLTVTVHERAPLVGDSPAASPIRDAFRDAWRNFVGLVAWLIASSGVLIPLGAVAFVAWRLVARGRRRARG